MHLAVLGGEQVGEFVHVLFDQVAELEHDARAALRVGRRPGGLCVLRRIDRLLEIGSCAEADIGLHLALVGIEHLALTLAGSEGGTADEMIDAAKHGLSVLNLLFWGRRLP